MEKKEKVGVDFFFERRSVRLFVCFWRHSFAISEMMCVCVCVNRQLLSVDAFFVIGATTTTAGGPIF